LGRVARHRAGRNPVPPLHRPLRHAQAGQPIGYGSDRAKEAFDEISATVQARVESDVLRKSRITIRFGTLNNCLFGPANPTGALCLENATIPDELTGAARHTDGQLTKQNLWKEAGVSRATMNRAHTILAEWNDQVAQHSTADPETARRDRGRRTTPRQHSAPTGTRTPPR
jgi:hypothetical protein